MQLLSFSEADPMMRGQGEGLGRLRGAVPCAPLSLPQSEHVAFFLVFHLERRWHMEKF